MSSKISTEKTRSTSVWPEVLGALVAWAVATAIVVTFAPTLAAVSEPVMSVAVAVILFAMGYGVARMLPEGRGLPFGIAVVISGQLLDAVLILATDQRYPRTDLEGTAHISMLFLVGYATFLVGTILGDRRG